MQLPESFTKVTPLSKGIAMILFALLPFIGFFIGVKYQQLININNIPNLCQVSATPTPNDVQTMPESEYVSSSTLYLARYLGKYNANGDFIDNSYADIIVEYPDDITVTQKNMRQEIRTKTETYEIQTGAPPGIGFCPWEDDGSGCAYTDEKYGTGILRSWFDKRGIFVLNFQSIYIKGYYTDHFEVFKTGPTMIFTDQDISFWKQWINKAKVDLQESR
jgi:hypothetical protein